ncbi:hypothetical protein J1N35_014171 [Gossypium stocksii]|uniref:Uncharacterized protein n=1 Tax=Gossypium stocksii TaxID=47602 RepID=A0A9D4A8M0_9ROSI|nr:hypothetical protein J1N35_014171 [Gossypium stocksii]
MLLYLGWIIQWIQEAGQIFEDYARKSGLKLLQFLATKYDITIELSKVKKKRELEEEEDPKEDPVEESKGEQSKANKASDPDFD